VAGKKLETQLAFQASVSIHLSFHFAARVQTRCIARALHCAPLQRKLKAPQTSARSASIAKATAKAALTQKAQGC
jgi:hypothetical protein